MTTTAAPGCCRCVRTRHRPSLSGSRSELEGVRAQEVWRVGREGRPQRQRAHHDGVVDGAEGYLPGATLCGSTRRARSAAPSAKESESRRTTNTLRQTASPTRNERASSARGRRKVEPARQGGLLQRDCRRKLSLMFGCNNSEGRSGPARHMNCASCLGTTPLHTAVRAVRTRVGADCTAESQ